MEPEASGERIRANVRFLSLHDLKLARAFCILPLGSICSF